jgi:hypothetical protein
MEMQKAHFVNIESTLLKEFSLAKKEICIAVAWFVNERLFEGLLEALKSGVDLKLIVLNDIVNNRKGGLNFQRLIYRRAKFHFAKQHKLMHNKFCVIDSKKVFTGSYNFTYAAEKSNFENMIEVADLNVASSYLKQFQYLLSVSDNVDDIGLYLVNNPPIDNSLGSTEVLNDEFIFKDSTEHSVLDEAYNNETLLPVSAKYQEYQEEKRKVYLTLAKNVEEFCERYPRFLTYPLGRYYPWNADVLELYLNKIHYSHLQANTAIEWTYDLICKFKNILFHNESSGGPSFIYNDSIKVSLNELNELDYRLYDRYHRNKNLYQFDDSTIDPDEPFFINRIVNEDNKLKTVARSGNNETQLRFENNDEFWTADAVMDSIGDINFWYSTPSSKIEWNRELLLAIKSKRDWQYFMFCSSIYLSNEELNIYSDVLDWKGIASNERINWTIELFEKHREQLLLHPNEFCINRNFPWTLEFIDRIADKLDFKALSSNPTIPFTQAFMLKHKDKWRYTARPTNQYSLSDNPSVKWSPFLMEELKDKIDWVELASNESVEWSLSLIQKYMPKSDSDRFITNLAYNKTVWERVTKPFINEAFLLKIAPKLPQDRWFQFVVR